ncbi:response regulator transcription factor [Sphingosinicella sp. LHD-64]|uniref:response regulator transcription factor n=1 Tax=Sphingosinicella sp. LHD-64 TaxID=3072139 RepID=UPI00280CF80F|nr:response regulator transcription factor [Sphingosinicella sp. LHD-64]MDQ8755722.1 response regulator transcription factor [Sphingosinicella sp. LHD-64]
MIRVCLADDQALVRNGIGALLRFFDDIDVVAEAEDGDAAIEAVLRHSCDVLLLDIRMPGKNGLQVIDVLAGRDALPPTLLLTTFQDDAVLVAGIRAGARGFLLKGVTAEILVDAIRTLATGGTYLFAPLAAAPAPDGKASWRDDMLDCPDPLTTRERDVLTLMTSGISNAEIARALSLREGTVRNHVSNILSKLGVGDRTKAVLVALERRLA